MPDFFLPDLGIYVECTVMRQALAGMKRRKARKLREWTGSVIVIPFRRDFERLVARSALPRVASGGCFALCRNG